MPDIFLYVKIGPKLFDTFFHTDLELYLAYIQHKAYVTVYLFVSGICIHVSMATPTDLYVPVHYWTGIFIYQYSKN